MYNINKQIRLKTSTLKSNLCDYSDTYILVGETIEIPNTGTAVAPKNYNN